ncbi:hypothetical protein CRYUN_Cryun17cG0078400 [Craigia yunnanensis]
MADYEPTHHQTHQHQTIPKETALQALNTIIQLHFEKTLEKKRAIDIQKKELHKLFQLFFIFLGLIFMAQALSTLAQTLRCINGFKYQRRCHKLTLGLATDKLREVKLRINNGEFVDGFGEEGEFQIHYQEPPESYFAKFKRNWALHFGFLILTYAFMVSSSVALLCF